MRRVSVCETLRKYYGNVEHVEGLENVGKRTPADPMETVCLTGVLVVLFRALKLRIRMLRVLKPKRPAETLH